MSKTEIFPVLSVGSNQARERLKRIKNRNVTVSSEVVAKVEAIVRAVRAEGDSALIRFTQEFDKVSLTNLQVSRKDIDEAPKKTDARLLEIIRESADNVRRFHERQRQNSWMEQDIDGTILGQRVIPLERVALYVPGGTAAYPSTVIMNAVPAQVAGVKDICVVTPPSKDGSVNAVVLAACSVLGIENVYCVGGAQGIGAAAYGTETIKKVDKIVGPGNVFVAAAKKLVYGDVDIDMIAGPSEVAVLADSTAVPAEIAADLLAQAEHDRNAAAVLVTTERKIALKVQNEIKSFLQKLPRKDIANESMYRNGAAFVTRDIEEAVGLVNEIAPEHLEIVAKDDWDILGRIKNAGAVFIGRYSPEPVGDYFAGPSHVLPTGGTARFSSVLNVDSFVKRSSIVYYSKKAFERNSRKIRIFAESEGLTAHALSIKVREKGGRKR
ncbi:MAG: histidinol dehydrogenase [Bacteroidetes bacterium]|nr:histidinol dehydrogenase [Bacteroidota bacterium]MCL5267826.1 histidinol dehydrogenase [Bacteroidota bacterium]